MYRSQDIERWLSVQYTPQYCSAVVSFTKPRQWEKIVFQWRQTKALLHRVEKARTRKSHQNGSRKYLKVERTKLACTTQALCFPGPSTRLPQPGEKQVLRGTPWSIPLSVLSQQSPAGECMRRQSLVCSTNAEERRPLATKMGDAFQIELLRSFVEASAVILPRKW